MSADPRRSAGRRVRDCRGYCGEITGFEERGGAVAEQNASNTSADDAAQTRHQRYGRLPGRVRPAGESVDTRPGDRAGAPAGDPEAQAVIRTAGF
jgi:hypothetical protein